MSRRRKKDQLQKSDKIEIFAFIVKVLSILFFFISSIYCMRHYNNFIIIRFEYYLVIYLISGFLFGLLFYNYQKKSLGKKFKLLEHFILIIFIYGSISSSIFFLANEYLSTNKEYIVVSPILEKHEGYKRSPHSILVDIEGTKREINIHHYDIKEIYLYNFAEIKIKKGYWNFPIIMETTLKLDK